MKRKTLTIFSMFLFISSTYGQEIKIQELLHGKQCRTIIEQAKLNEQPDTLDFETLYLYGQAFEGVFQYREALAHYDLCFRMDSTHSGLLNTMARTAMNLGRAPAAEKYFKMILENDSTDFYTNYQLARLYHQTGEYQQAMEIYDYLLEQDETNVTILRNLGDCCLKLEDMEYAIYYYHGAWSNNPENAALASTLINLMMNMSFFYGEQIIHLCDEALSYNPGNRMLLQNKAMALYVNKYYEQSDSLYTQLLLEGDSSYLTLKYGGAARYNAGLYYSSVELLELAYDKDTTSIDVCLLLGSALGKTYDRKRALELLDQAERNMAPLPAHTYQLALYRAETLKKDGNFKKSSEIYYDLWKENNKRLKCLYEILTSDGYIRLTPEATEEERQKALFINMLFATEFLRTEEDPVALSFSRHLLNAFYEDMFFRGIEELPALAPDGKKSTVKASEIKALIDLIPEDTAPSLQ